MLKKIVSGTILTLLLIAVLTLAFKVQPVKTELIERRAGVDVEDWVEYKNYSFSWKSNVPYDELKSDFKSFIKNHVDLYSFKVVVLEISDTLVKYQSLLRFKNGTEQVIQTFVNIETGTGSNMWLMGANLSDGDSIYTHYSDWIITETIQSVYLGDSREVNLLLGKTTNYTSGPYTVGLNFTIVWDRLTGILLEWHGLLEATEDNQTVTYSFNLEITGTNKWGYKIWIVDDDGPADFSMIQEAINAANPGDTIFVRNGTYYENVVVNKTVSVIGENIGTTIIDGNGTGNVVLVEGVDDITTTGFTVRNGSNGFYIVGLNHTVIRNIILNNTYHGIDIVGRNNQISENIIANNRYAIVLDASSYNIISRNTIMRNQGGINLCEDCEYNEISKNTLMNNTMGIGILGNNNSVVENTIKENWSGIQIAGTNNTIYHNNFINNTNQVYLEYSLPNSWDNNYPSGGNYWSDYNGTDLCSGPLQNETASDGIGDIPYVIDENNQDDYPLMKPWGVISGNLQILKPINESAIVGSVNITFSIENWGRDVKFLKGNASNRVDLEIEYRSTCGKIYGWGIMLWSTSSDGLMLRSRDKYIQTVLYDPSEHEEAVPPDFIGDAPYGEATIRLVHWKQIDTGYSYGEFGMTEVNVTLQPIDTTPPTITLLSPQNKTYTTTSVPLTFTPNETTSWIGYSLDNQANVTITGNTTLTGLSEGTHSITVYANDTTGNMGASEIVYFTVALPYGPTAEFTVTPETADVGESVKFDASASLPGWNGTHGMPITEYRWDFGGSIKITTSTPIVYYSFISPGIYYVTLTVYAPGAIPETDSTTQKVTVISMPVGGYSVPIEGYTTTKPLAFYLALVAILTTVFTAIKRKTHRRTKR